ncbi:MAG: Gmad2 immunoglobulin-like domain-containing protein [Patescibacteria group bacterium]
MIKLFKLIIIMFIALSLGWLVVNYQKDVPSDDIVNESEELENDEVENITKLIKVEFPQTNQVIASPLIVKGEARGYWFFEGDFPAYLLDGDDNELAIGIAQANPPAGGDWMTEEFVPFEAILYFDAPPTNTGTLVLQKDNPSGLPELARELRVPVVFEVTAEPAPECIITGCSNQVCAEEEVITTCEFKPEYVCYSKAICERQGNGECGWIETDDLAVCLEEFTD